MQAALDPQGPQLGLHAAPGALLVLEEFTGGRSPLGVPAVIAAVAQFDLHRAPVLAERRIADPGGDVQARAAQQFGRGSARLGPSPGRAMTP
jgi:hypothetical protein